jgi:hypothetical protein
LYIASSYVVDACTRRMWYVVRCSSYRVLVAYPFAAESKLRTHDVVYEFSLAVCTSHAWQPHRCSAGTCAQQALHAGGRIDGPRGRCSPTVAACCLQTVQAATDGRTWSGVAESMLDDRRSWPQLAQVRHSAGTIEQVQSCIGEKLRKISENPTKPKRGLPSGRCRTVWIALSGDGLRRGFGAYICHIGQRLGKTRREHTARHLRDCLPVVVAVTLGAYYDSMRPGRAETRRRVAVPIEAPPPQGRAAIRACWSP